MVRFSNVEIKRDKAVEYNENLPEIVHPINGRFHDVGLYDNIATLSKEDFENLQEHGPNTTAELLQCHKYAHNAYYSEDAPQSLKSDTFDLFRRAIPRIRQYLKGTAGNDVRSYFESVGIDLGK